jgi:tagatose 6-phosphate kinase
LNVIDESDGCSTELLEAGPTIVPVQFAELKKRVRELAAESSVVVLSGSLPTGVPSDAYRELIAIIRSAGAQAFLDTSGAALVVGVEAAPDFIKPNETELAQLSGGQTLSDDGALPGLLLELARRKELPRLCVTLGERGALACIGGAVYRALPPAIAAVNTVGCGDAFVAGMAYALELGAEPAKCLSIATAAAAANALDERAGYVDIDTFRSLLAKVKVEKLN